MVRVMIVDSQIEGCVQCSKSHESSLATSCHCWSKFWKSRLDLPDSRRWRTEREEQLQRQIKGDAAKRPV